MDYHKLLEPLRRRMATMIGRCILTALDSGPGVQSAVVTIMADEPMRGVEYMEPYGFTSRALAGAEGVVLNVGAQRGACVALSLGNRQYRLRALQSGEVALYTDEGDKLVFERGNMVRLTTKSLVVEAAEAVTLNAGRKVTLNAPETEVTGHLTVLKGLTWGGAADGLDGPARMTGGLTNTGGEVVSNGKALDSHTHTCPHGGSTGGPQ